MKTLYDYQGRAIRLTDERLAHIVEHPEMQAMEQAIQDTVLTPVRVVQSQSDPGAKLYYRFYVGTLVGDKFLCVVVKFDMDDAFVLTAYLTDEIKKGTEIWPTSA